MEFEELFASLRLSMDKGEDCEAEEAKMVVTIFEGVAIHLRGIDRSLERIAIAIERANGDR